MAGQMQIQRDCLLSGGVGFDFSSNGSLVHMSWESEGWWVCALGGQGQGQG